LVSFHGDPIFKALDKIYTERITSSIPSENTVADLQVLLDRSFNIALQRAKGSHLVQTLWLLFWLLFERQQDFGHKKAHTMKYRLSF
jgi:hypothetical protein